MHRTTIVVAVVALSACTSAGIGSAPNSSTSHTVVATAPAATNDVAASPTLVSVVLPPGTIDDGANPLGGHAPEDSLMPQVVCMNLQDAQNEIQDHGVFFSRSEDATGRGRNQIIDRNWQVVGQSPDAGVPIGEGDATLSVVKYGEQPNPC
jgi:hypothetical protein